MPTKLCQQRKNESKLFEKFNHSALETDMEHFKVDKIYLQKMILKKKKSYIEEELSKNSSRWKEFQKALKPHCLKSNKARKSKRSLKKGGKIQFEVLENIIFKHFEKVLL